MSKVEDFLTSSEEREVVEAIRIAEKNTSGEIRVHIEKKLHCSYRTSSGSIPPTQNGYNSRKKRRYYIHCCQK
jgi:hypothetical protein